MLETIAGLYGSGVSVREVRGVGGGCINETCVLTLSTGARLFLKSNSLQYEGLFSAERAGLDALRMDSGPRVPRPLAVVSDERRQFLLLEFVESGEPVPDFWEDFGHRMARLHHPVIGRGFGFDVDNYIGATRQPNTPSSDWIEFFGERRLGFQINLARREGRADRQIEIGVTSIIKRLGELLPRPNGSSTLHGDLWSGNFMCDESGHAVIIDPAVYWGHPECDIAMTHLFGGFSSSFYHAYDEVLPQIPGFEGRIGLYNLYHLLNHLNLFGASYLPGVRETVSRYR